MNKPKLILIEAPQGGGKSSSCRLLREKMPNTTLLSLSSIEDDTAFNTYLYHSGILSMLQDLSNLGSSFVLDRSFLSNYVYYKLGFKKYDWEQEYDWLCRKLKLLEEYFDVSIFILATSKEEYERRLNKRDKYEYIKMSSENSMKQQREYLDLFFDLKDKGFNIHVINNTNTSKEQTVNLIISQA